MQNDGGAGRNGWRAKAIALRGVVLLCALAWVDLAHGQTASGDTADVTPPSAPSSLTSIGATNTTLSLSWTASTDDVRVERYDVYDGTTLLWYTTAPTAVVQGLSPGRTYDITVRARDAAGNVSAPSSSLTVTMPTDVPLPTAPGTPFASEVTAASVRLSWAPSTGGYGGITYTVYGVTGMDILVVGVTTAETSVVVTNLSPSTTYTMYVTARDAAGNPAPRSPGSVTVRTLPAPPVGCTATIRIITAWPGGYLAALAITNFGTQALNSWTVSWTLPAGQAITQVWNAAATTSGSAVTLRNMSYNGTLAAGAWNYDAAGFLGSWGGTTGFPSVPASVGCGP